MRFISFLPPAETKNEYVHMSKNIDGVRNFGGHPDLCAAALDLCKTTFCVPVMDRCFESSTYHKWNASNCSY